MVCTELTCVLCKNVEKNEDFVDHFLFVIVIVLVYMSLASSMQAVYLFIFKTSSYMK